MQCNGYKTSQKSESVKIPHLIIASTTPVYTSTSLLNLIIADYKIDDTTEILITIRMIC